MTFNSGNIISKDDVESINVENLVSDSSMTFIFINTFYKITKYVITLFS